MVTSYLSSNLCINNPFVGLSKLELCPTKSWKLCNVVTHNIILANQKTESSLYLWLSAHAIFDVMRFPAFFRPPDVISSVLSILNHLYRYSMMVVSIRIGWCLYRYCTDTVCIVPALVTTLITIVPGPTTVRTYQLHVNYHCAWTNYSQTCINGHLDIAWPCLMWPLSGPTDEIPYILNFYIAWPCPMRSAATYFQSQTRKICPITVTTECVRLQFSRRVKISRYTIANQATVNETGFW